MKTEKMKQLPKAKREEALPAMNLNEKLVSIQKDLIPRKSTENRVPIPFGVKKRNLEAKKYLIKKNRITKIKSFDLDFSNGLEPWQVK